MKFKACYFISTYDKYNINSYVDVFLAMLDENGIFNDR